MYLYINNIYSIGSVSLANADKSKCHGEIEKDYTYFPFVRSMLQFSPRGKKKPPFKELTY